MARIRSIKPEFWTSETIAGLSIGTRLTFIGLWSYVDDNGVGIANERLIASSLYPMDDPREALARVREALAELSAAGRVALYEAAGKRYVYITTWDEHQRVDKPRKPRYPRPSECDPQPVPPPLTSADTDRRDNVTTMPRSPRENLAKPREAPGKTSLGAGSREQGTGGSRASAREAPPPDRGEPPAPPPARERAGRPPAPRTPSVPPGPTTPNRPTGSTPARRPADRCQRHLHEADPPPCGPCADARRAATAWTPPTPADRPAAAVLADLEALVAADQRTDAAGPPVPLPRGRWRPAPGRDAGVAACRAALRRGAGRIEEPAPESAVVAA